MNKFKILSFVVLLTVLPFVFTNPVFSDTRGSFGGWDPLSVSQGGTEADNPTEARVNLGLLDMSIQAPGAVDITGGTIDSVTITNGTITTDGDIVGSQIYFDQGMLGEGLGVVGNGPDLSLNENGLISANSSLNLNVGDIGGGGGLFVRYGGNTVNATEIMQVTKDGELSTLSTITAGSSFITDDPISLKLISGDASIFFDSENAPDGLGVKRITTNDGGGNFNIRAMSYYDSGDKYSVTGDGAVHIEMTTEGARGKIDLKVADTGTSGDIITWADHVKIANGIFYNDKPIWHEDNDGSTSGLDADTLDGYDSAITAVASSIVLRDTLGDITGRQLEFSGGMLGEGLGTVGNGPDLTFGNNGLISAGTGISLNIGSDAGNGNLYVRYGGNTSNATEIMLVTKDGDLSTVGTITAGSSFITDFADSMLLTSGQASIFFDSENAPDGLGVKRITSNDGGGNFNIRAMSYYDSGDKYSITGDGAAHIEIHTESSQGKIELKVAEVGTAGDIITWADIFKINAGIFYNDKPVWHEDNDGSASGLDADTLDGYEIDATATIDTIVIRDANNRFALADGENDDQAITKGYVDTAIAGVESDIVSEAPVGMIVAWPTSTVPPGFLECNGATLATATYPELHAVVGYTYGLSGGSFKIPNYKGVFLRGWDHGRGLDPGPRTNRGDGTTGDNVGTAEGDASETHDHAYNNRFAGVDAGMAQYWDWNHDAPFGGSGTADETVKSWTTSPYTGSSETRPWNVNVMYIIKY